jgi:uncharacterized protein YjiS (DUF1127 family)
MSHRSLSSVCCGIGRAAARSLAVVPAVLHGRWRRRALRRTLDALTARELRDLALSRAEFDAVADGSYCLDATRRARCCGRRGA